MFKSLPLLSANSGPSFTTSDHAEEGAGWDQSQSGSVWEQRIVLGTREGSLQGQRHAGICQRRGRHGKECPSRNYGRPRCQWKLSKWQTVCEILISMLYEWVKFLPWSYFMQKLKVFSCMHIKIRCDIFMHILQECKWILHIIIIR